LSSPGKVLYDLGGFQSFINKNLHVFVQTGITTERTRFAEAERKPLHPQMLKKRGTEEGRKKRSATEEEESAPYSKARRGAAKKGERTTRSTGRKRTAWRL